MCRWTFLLRDSVTAGLVAAWIAVTRRRGDTRMVTSGLATLRLEPAVVTRAFEDGNITRYPESHFLDLVVNNRSLRASVGEPARHLVTELNRPWLPAVPKAVSRFLGRRTSEDLASERRHGRPSLRPGAQLLSGRSEGSSERFVEGKQLGRGVASRTNIHSPLLFD